MTATVTLLSPTGQRDRHGDVAHAGRAGGPLPACRAPRAAPTQIVVTGGPGEYTVQPTLNAYLDPAAYGGSPNGSIATATPIDPYANKFAGNDDRTAVLGGRSAAAAARRRTGRRPTGSAGLYSRQSSTRARRPCTARLQRPLPASAAWRPPAPDNLRLRCPRRLERLITGHDHPRATCQETIIGPQIDLAGDLPTPASVYDGTLYGFSFTRGRQLLDPLQRRVHPDLHVRARCPKSDRESRPSIRPTATVYAVGQSRRQHLSRSTLDRPGPSTFVGDIPVDLVEPATSMIGLAIQRRQPSTSWATNGDVCQPTDRSPADRSDHDRRRHGDQFAPNGTRAQPDAIPLSSPAGGGGGVGERRCRSRQPDLLVRAQPGRERHDRHREPQRQEGRRSRSTTRTATCWRIS